MSEFEREERYIVVKLKRIDEDEQNALRGFLASYQIPTEQCVVIEHDWPIYEETWENVERLAKGEDSIRDELEGAHQRITELEQREDMFKSLLDEYLYAKNLSDEEIRPYLWNLYENRSPVGSLARRDARVAAAVWDQVAVEVGPDGAFMDMDALQNHAESERDRLRREAEGGDL